MNATPRHKFSVGPFQGWLVGPQSWQVRDKRTGEIICTARNMSDCCRKAESLHMQEHEAALDDFNYVGSRHHY